MIEYRPFDIDRDIEETVRHIHTYKNKRYTKDLLLWKHTRNPFGESKGGLALYEGKIIATVIYMKYNFQSKDKGVIRCLRGVDGCTAPQHRGKGIFKKLLRFSLDLHEGNYEFLYANPNQNSHPEMMKVGWKSLHRDFHYRVGVVAPSIKNDGEIRDFNPIDASEVLYYNYYTSANSTEFLKWRYERKEYKLKEFSFQDSKNYLAYRINRYKGIKYIIFCDYVGDINSINKAIKALCKYEKCHIIYYFPNAITNQINFLYTKKEREVVLIFQENNFHIDDNLIMTCGDAEGIL